MLKCTDDGRDHCSLCIPGTWIWIVVVYLTISRVWVAWCGAVAASRATFVLIPGKNCYQMEVNLLMQNTATCRYETIRTINSGLGTQFSQKPRIHWIADKYLQKCSPRLRANCEEGLSKFAVQIVAKMSDLSGRKCVYYRAAEWVSHGQLPPAVHINSTPVPMPRTQAVDRKPTQQTQHKFMQNFIGDLD